MSLKLIDSASITTNTAQVVLNNNNDFDVHLLQYINVHTTVDGASLNFRFNNGGTAVTSSNYDSAETLLYEGGYINEQRTGAAAFSTHRIGTANQEAGSGHLWLFCFNDASMYSFATIEGNNLENTTGRPRGKQGGATLTIAQVNDGVTLYTSSGSIAKGEFRLYAYSR